MTKLKLTLFSCFWVIVLSVPSDWLVAQNGGLDCDNLLNINFGAARGSLGEEVCLDVSFENFEDMLAVQTAINFNPTVLEFTRISTDNATNSFGFENQIFATAAEVGILRLFWQDIDAIGIDIPDGDITFSVCFQIIDRPQASTQVSINTFGLDIEYVQRDDDNPGDRIVGDICVTPGEVEITCDSYGSEVFVCNSPAGASEGSIRFYACGGFPPYSYELDGQTGTLDGDNVEGLVDNLPTGSYTLIITDQSNQQIFNNITIFVGSDIDLDINAVEPACADQEFPNGSITVMPSGGSTPYYISWASTPVDTNRLEFLPNGSYTVFVEDAMGCKAEETIVFDVGDVEVQFDLIQGPLCDDDNSFGAANISATGGIPIAGTDYQFEMYDENDDRTRITTDVWNNIELPSGELRFVAKDATGFCESDTFRINLEPGKTLGLNLEGTNAGCAAAASGMIRAEVFAFQGTAVPGFRYAIFDESNNMLGAPVTVPDDAFDFNDLEAGMYTVIVTDGDGCEISESLTIEQDANINLQLVGLEQPGCSGSALGSISLSTDSPNEPIIYTWSDGGSGATRDDLDPGTYGVTATDQTGCTAEDSFIINFDSNDAMLIIDDIIVAPLRCSGDSDASITVEIQGGNDDIQFDFGNGFQDSNQIFGLAAGDVMISVQSANGCSTSVTVPIDAVDPITFSPSPTEPRCASELGNIGVIPDGGTAPYFYEWDHPNDSGGSILAGVPAGSYDVTITDSNSCTVETSVTLDEPSAVSATAVMTSAILCSDSQDGQAFASGLGGSPAGNDYEYFWSNMETDFGPTGTTDGLSAGQNWLIVSDGVCLSDTIFFNIDAPEVVALDLDNSTLNMPSCFGRSDGSVTAVGMGGTGSYTFQWPQFTTDGATVQGLESDSLVVFIRDANDCEQEARFFLDEPDRLVARIDSSLTTNVNCFSQETARIQVVHTGGNDGPFTYQWTNDVSDSDLALNLGLGLYEITVTDINMCEATTQYEVGAPDPVIAEIPIPEPPICNGDGGLIQIDDASGGSGAPFTYSINNGPSIPIDSVLSVFPGEYLVKVFDNSGCSTETFVTVTPTSPINIDLIETLELDLGDEAMVSVETIGTVDIASIIWSPDQNIECLNDICSTVNISGLGNETYEVLLTDVNGCTATRQLQLIVDDRRNVYIPNAFNLDSATHPRVTVEIGSGATEVLSFDIFDRLGNHVHQMRNDPDSIDNISWDGSWKGQVVDPGVFIYRALVRFDDGEEIFYSGSITVIN